MLVSALSLSAAAAPYLQSSSVNPIQPSTGADTVALQADPLAPPGPSTRITALLSEHDVSAEELLFMSAEAYQLPAPSNSTGQWMPKPLKPVLDLVLPSTLYEHKGTGSQILALQGVSGAIPAQYCGAAIEFTRSAGQHTWDAACADPAVGNKSYVSLSLIASQIDKLLDANPAVKFLTGHSLGCFSVLSVGRVRNMPVVCYSTSGSFPATWVADWPGLSSAVLKPPRTDLFTLQAWSDPLSNCLTPRLEDDSTRSWAAAACSFKIDQICNATVGFSYSPTTQCIIDTHYAANLLPFAPKSFAPGDCSDFCGASIAHCPTLPPATCSV